MTPDLCILRYTRCSGERVGVYWARRSRIMRVEIDGAETSAMRLPPWRDHDAAALDWCEEDRRACLVPGESCTCGTYGWPRAAGAAR